MKKIAILACLKANDVCAGVSCLQAFYGRKASFAPYQGEELILCAFLRCSQCNQDPLSDKGMIEKLHRILSCGVEVVHIGVCAKKRDGTPCTFMAQAADFLSDQGVGIVWGTHG
jgi:hypothetical protein